VEAAAKKEGGNEQDDFPFGRLDRTHDRRTSYLPTSVRKSINALSFCFFLQNGDKHVTHRKQQFSLLA
jgi:hypothetical protein